MAHNRLTALAPLTLDWEQPESKVILQVCSGRCRNAQVHQWLALVPVFGQGALVQAENEL